MRLWGLRGPQPLENGLHLAWCEDLAGGFVACFLQLVPEHVAAADEGHEVVDRHAGGAVGEEEEGEFFFAVGADVEMFHFW